MRVTLDVNVLVSGFPADRGTMADLLAHWEALEFEIVISEPMLSEAAEAWAQPYWAARFSSHRVQAVLRRLRAEATLVVPVASVRGVGEDEEDDLATAITGAAAYLVTGDKHLQGIGHFQGVAILSPRQFLEILSAHGSATG